MLFLIAGIALLGWHHARTHGEDGPVKLPASDPLAALRITPSMRATAKYFWVVLALFLVQILLGAMTAHYQVEGQVAYGFNLSNILPYSITRTWHTQLAVLWIAVAWLGTGLYIAPALSGHEPKFQRLGVKLRGFLGAFLVPGLEHAGLAVPYTTEFPCVEEGCPVDVVHQLTQGLVWNRPRASELRHGWRIA